VVDVRVVMRVEGGRAGASGHCVYDETLHYEALFCRNTHTRALITDTGSHGRPAISTLAI